MGTSKKALRARRGTRGNKPGEGGIPADARYVNVTTLDDDLLERTAKLEQSAIANRLCLAVGIAMIAFAGVTLLFLHADAVVAAIIAILGAVVIYQAHSSARRMARNYGRSLDQAGEDGRKRMTFFTATEMGTVDSDGSVHTLPYSAIDRVIEDDRMFAIRMSDEGGLMAIAKSGFTHGRAEDFGNSIRRRVAEAHRQLSGQLKQGKRKDPSARGK